MIFLFVLGVALVAYALAGILGAGVALLVLGVLGTWAVSQ